MQPSRRSLRLALLLGLAAPALALGPGAARADIVVPQPDIQPVAPKPQAVKPATKPAATADATAKAPPADTAAPSDTAAPADAAGEALPPEISEQARKILAIQWQQGPTAGSLGTVAEIQVPEGVIFADAEGTRRFLELNENPTSGSELGMVAAPDFSWSMIFEFSDIGYVKDDEKEEIDAAAILQSLREGNAHSNELRRARGWGTVSLIGWAEPPRYEPTTHNLEWATTGQDDQDKSQIINHNIRVLGRRGVMEASLIVPPDGYAAALPTARKLLTGFGFKTGEAYSEYRTGDRIAEVGLIGLMTGGAVAVAAKTGILAKLGKVGVKAIALLVAAGGAIAAKLFGRKKE